uniref:Prefoldin subunit 1 n=1 Tax=Mus spicilegus TaxID=10103 RepID=A0A8C6IGD1_MUSSI
MAASVDLELKKAFTELQAKVIDTQQKVKLADIQIEQLNRTKKHAHLTDTEIMTLVDETNMYEGVGRMFILQSKEVIHNQLLEKQKIAEEKIKELEVCPTAAITFQGTKSVILLCYTKGKHGQRKFRSSLVLSNLF